MINVVYYFMKGKIAFQVLLIIIFRWASITCQLNLYDTDPRFKSHSLQSDCLNYHVRRENSLYEELSDVVDEIIPYCSRPTNDFYEIVKAFDNNLFSQKLSFEELRITNINPLRLLSWSMSIEVVERYQLYLNKPTSALNEQIYNCTSPRFGLQCEYSFEFAEGMSFNEIVVAYFHGRQPYSDSSDKMVQVPCYIHLQCHRNGELWCLDWREVCDGNIDCLDEGLDEKFCFDMEVNECNDDEYRCHNGLCIAQELWENGVGDTDCLDRSDRAIDTFYIKSCFQDPTFRCEEHSCGADFNSFACGDGQCVTRFQDCYNGRHVLLIDSMKVKGELTDACWNAMICLTKLVKKINEILCEVWLMNNSTGYIALQQCEPFFQFPIIPVHSNHVRFFYENVHLRSSTKQILIPDYICYDQQLCDSFIPDLEYENLTCLKTSQVILMSDFIRNTFYELMSLVREYFHYCLLSYDTFQNKINYIDHPSLYNCQNSLKIISKHRIMDGIYDCFHEDDEDYIDSCKLNDRHRVTCIDKEKCWSSLVKNDACNLNGVDDLEKIRFENFCDGIDTYFYDLNKQNYSDEFGCGDWSCNSIYTRCDGFWACNDGRDEENCGRRICPSQTFPCISPVNYTVFCLNFSYVNNDIVDCLGALDEQTICRSARIHLEDSFYRFRCSNGQKCLQVSQLCDKKNDCLEGDDEDFCKDQSLNTCDQHSAYNHTEIEQILCELKEEGSRTIKYFSVHTSPIYPSLEQSLVTEFIYRSEEQNFPKNSKPLQFHNSSWPWYCNRGLVLHNWIQNNISQYVCRCPPSYYGNLCQYQNQRISLTLRLTSNDRQGAYAIVSMLIDDSDEQQEINAYDQSVYIAKQSCSMKLNRYLLFSTQPKNISKNYIVRIDVFEKNTTTYIGSWHFPINFLFLPVNRLSIVLNLANDLFQHSINCSKNCTNGQCIKYINKPMFFCRCFSNWSGSQCNIPTTNCTRCSSDSICIGSIGNRSICVCPLNKFGSQCLLTSTCPINACQNNGRCIPADISIPGTTYTCICSDRFFGQNCEFRKATLDVSIINIYTPLYLVAYFFTLSNKSEPIEMIVVRKLTLFQHIVTFHIAVPFQLTLIQANNKYYLAVLQQSPKTDISTLINSKQECIPIDQLLNSTILQLIEYKRIIYFHLLCQINFNLTCFIDIDYFCLCTNDHHANCMKFKHQRNFTCSLDNYCANHGQCLQNHPTCPSTRICLCPSCFFGNRCQFYAKGLGSTLDEILGYEFKRNTALFKQPITVILSALITMIISLIGIINSILSIIIFLRAKSQEVGCGRYLLASSITSLCTTILLTLKFWFLFYSYQNHNRQRDILKGNCFGIEPLLKAFLYLDTWLNACVAIERTTSVIQGVNFNKNRSKKIANKIILFLIIMIGCLFIPQLIHLHIFYDETEERSWCVVRYVEWLAIYSSSIIFIHYFAPLAINIFSIIFIIIITARRQARLHTNHDFCIHLRSRIRKHKHILISSSIIICLTLPHLIISIILDCHKSSHLFSFYITGYFLSFFPAAFIFIIFVLPSRLYRQEFNQFIIYIRRRFEIFQLNSSKFKDKLSPNIDRNIRLKC